MILKTLVEKLDSIFQKKLAFEWDNVGLQVGNLDKDIKKILITLNLDHSVVNEAVNSRVDLILAHHPLIFNPIKSIISSDIPQKKILSLIENRIALYVVHTNYDIMQEGLNEYVARRLGLVRLNVIDPHKTQWYKFVIFVPLEAEEEIRKVICKHGGGKWRNYSCCTFNVRGKGTFVPLEGANPYIGEVGKISYVDEVRIECIVSEDILDEVVSSAIRAHPYEEVAYDIYKIENKFDEVGVGRVGELEEPEYFVDFLQRVKEKMEVRNLRWLCENCEELKSKKISKVALVCGSANSMASKLASLDCDLVILGEINYHNALHIAESGKILIEIGHGCSEKWAVEDIYNKLTDLVCAHGWEIQLIKSKAKCMNWRFYID